MSSSGLQQLRSQGWSLEWSTSASLWQSSVFDPPASHRPSIQRAAIVRRRCPFRSWTAELVCSRARTQAYFQDMLYVRVTVRPSYAAHALRFKARPRTAACLAVTIGEAGCFFHQRKSSHASGARELLVTIRSYVQRRYRAARDHTSQFHRRSALAMQPSCSY